MKTEDLLYKLDELSLDMNNPFLVDKAINLIESQQQQIEILQHNNDLKDEIITNARKAYKELSEKVDKVLNEIGTL